MAVTMAAETASTTATTTSLEEGALDVGDWGRMREEMLAGKEAKAEGDGGEGGEGTAGKNGEWLGPLGVEVENGILVVGG